MWLGEVVGVDLLEGESEAAEGGEECFEGAGGCKLVEGYCGGRRGSWGDGLRLVWSLRGPMVNEWE